MPSKSWSRRIYETVIHHQRTLQKMKRIIVLLICLISVNSLCGQDKMIVNQHFIGSTVYGKYSANIDSLLVLPSIIQFNLKEHFDKILGSMSDSVTFSHGQVIDLENKFNNDSIGYSNSWIVPKYDLNFVLSDISLGIKSYYLQIRLDEYGQILKSNWPQEGYRDKNQFLNRSEIEKYALRRAEIKGFNPVDYEVDLKYNGKLDKLCWIFKFPSKGGKNIKRYNAFEIPWDSLRIIDEYEMQIAVVR